MSLTEIERKFLVTGAPDELAASVGMRIEQGYLAVGEDGTEVRVRRCADEPAVLTVKGPAQHAGRDRTEVELPLSDGQRGALWPLTEGRRIHKTRHRLSRDEVDVEVDVYGGGLAGLVVAEVEFVSGDAADAFDPPSWFGREVTTDDRFKNQCLAALGLPEAEHTGRVHHAFRLHPAETMPDEIRRLTVEQFDLALEALSPEQHGSGIDVHAARKACKRIRTVMRLVRDGLGEEVYARDNQVIREIGRRLSATRDAKVVAETLDALCGRYADELPPRAFSGLRIEFAAERKAAGERLAADGAELAAIRESLVRTRALVAAWQFDLTLEDLDPGWRRIYRRGRRALRVAAKAPTDENLHELRKRAKDAWYAAQVLKPLAPARFGRIARRAKALSSTIGADHDLAVLAAVAPGHSAVLAPGELELLQRLIARRRVKLQARTMRRGRRLYRRRPRRAGLT